MINRAHSMEQPIEKPREVPIGCEVEHGRGDRFVSYRTMNQIRLSILKRLTDRMKERLSP
jgi:hypothetical protein